MQPTRCRPGFPFISTQTVGVMLSSTCTRTACFGTPTRGLTRTRTLLCLNWPWGSFSQGNGGFSERHFAAKDQKLHTGACFLDMSKAFDKVRHHVLIQDLFEVGVAGRALSWIASYLSIRQQYVRFGTLQSGMKPCTCGVPQGSVLGPLLFSVYTRDVPSVVEPAKSIQFADDIDSIQPHVNGCHLS